MAQPGGFRVSDWTITGIVGISDRGWRRVSAIAWVVGLAAVAVGFVMVVAYAASVSINASMLGSASATGAAKTAFDMANVAVGVAQVAVAGMLQLGTDFGLLFAAGLAKARHRITPTAALVLWGICAWNTVEMEIGLYESLRDGRIEKLQAAADAPTPTVAAALAAIRPFQDGDGDGKPDMAPPAEIAVSNAAIVQANQTLADLAADKIQQAALRDEEAKTGRSVKWQAAVDAIAAIDGKVAAPRAAITAARKAIADRSAYDANLAAVEAWTKRPKVTASGLVYDSDLSIWLRTFGLSLLALISILVAFAADAAGQDASGARRRDPRAPEPDAPQPDPYEPPAASAGPRHGKSGEASPMRSRGLPFFGGTKPEVVGKVDPPVRISTVRPQSDKHPDKHGDAPPPAAVKPVANEPTNEGEG